MVIAASEKTGFTSWLCHASCSSPKNHFHSETPWKVLNIVILRERSDRRISKLFENTRSFASLRMTKNSAEVSWRFVITPREKGMESTPIEMQGASIQKKCSAGAPQWLPYPRHPRPNYIRSIFSGLYVTGRILSLTSSSRASCSEGVINLPVCTRVRAASRWLTRVSPVRMPRVL